MIDLDQIKDHIRNRPYMGGIERDALRIKALQEVFTPTPMVQEILDKLDPKFFKDLDQPFIDPTCGDGQFLGEVLIRKLEQLESPTISDFERALASLYGVDIDESNIVLCRERLLCGKIHLYDILEQHIVVGDAQTYNFTFGETEVFGNNLFEVIDK